MKTIYVAEKPSVAKLIADCIGGAKKKHGYFECGGSIAVTWCLGHLAELAEPAAYGWGAPWSWDQLPMIPGEFKLAVPDDKRAQFNCVKKLMGDAGLIVNACDPDREGQSIFRDVLLSSHANAEVRRLWLTSMEPSAVKQALGSLLNDADCDGLYNASSARRRADWLVGMNLSRALSIRYDARLATGRVQAAVLHMVAERDKAIDSFRPSDFWKVDLAADGFRLSSDRFDSLQDAEKCLAASNAGTAMVTSFTKEEKAEMPPLLYSQTELQKAADRMLGLSSDDTLAACQRMYEKGLLTYPRTDESHITEEMRGTVERAIPIALNVLGISADANDFKPGIGRTVVPSDKIAAHTAIVPTGATPGDLLTGSDLAVYKIVCLRMLEAFSRPRKYIAAHIAASCGDYDFAWSGTFEIDAGWRKLEYAAKVSADETGNVEEAGAADVELMPEGISEGEEIVIQASEIKKGQTSPPKKFTEASLLAAMESAGKDEGYPGIGTAATRAAIIAVLIRRGNIEKKGRSISATKAGVALDDVTPVELKSAATTASWEKELAEIESNGGSAEAFVARIGELVKELVGHEKADAGSKPLPQAFKREECPALKCPACGGDVRKGKYGYYCSSKCGMGLSKIFGHELSDAQVEKLLGRSAVTYSASGRKTKVLPEVEEYEYNGRKYTGWKTVSSYPSLPKGKGKRRTA